MLMERICRILWLAVLSVGTAFGVCAAGGDGEVTWSEHIAPVVFQRCAPCHHEGEPTPFELMTYEQVRRRGRQIVEVTGSGYMPPWPPGESELRLKGSRYLDGAERLLIRRWYEQGMLEGDTARMPEAPQWVEGWRLGEPDLVVEMDGAYELAADGPDVYRNFVMPTGLSRQRNVRAVEFRAGSRAVHHVFIKVDSTPQSREQDARDGAPGFPGFYVEGARMPEGQFVTWQPGKGPSIAPEGMPWVLDAETDLVVQMHLQPLGRLEDIRCRVGFYFTDEPVQRLPYKMALMSYQIDIPAGVEEHLVTDTFVLPVEVDLLGVLPHGHLLGKRFEGAARLPDGRELDLLTIADWDFNWQGYYQYEEPVHLPKGTELIMRYTYDNSTNNLRNPHHPPERVRYGPNSTDEMGEFWLQVLPRSLEGRKVLAAAYSRTNFLRIATYNEGLVRERPEDYQARIKLGSVRMMQRRMGEARELFEGAVRLRPDADEGHYFLGLVARTENRLEEARREFELAIRLNPANAKAHGNLGLVLLQMREVPEARPHFERALELNPNDEIARSVLEQMNPS